MPPGIVVPSFEQKQYGNWHAAKSHFCAKSIGVSVIGAGAEKKKENVKKIWISVGLNKRSGGGGGSLIRRE